MAVKRAGAVKPMRKRRPADDRVEIEQPTKEDVATEHRPDLEVLYHEMLRLKEEAAEFAKANGGRFAALETSVIDMMRKADIRRYEGQDIAAVLIEPETMVVDWDRIADYLGRDDWERVSTRQGDRAKLDAWLKGQPTSVKKAIARHITPKDPPTKPHVRITPVKSGASS